MTPSDYWHDVLDGEIGAEGCPFRQAQAHLTASAEGFRVRLLLPEEDTPFDGLADEVATLLGRYGITTVGERGIRQGADLVPLHDDVDVLVVFVLSNEVQALCSELANLGHTSSRLLPCVLEGRENNFFEQLLRQRHGVGTIRLPAERGPADGRNSFGIHVVRICANALVAKVSASRKRLRYGNTVVMLIHGIRTRGAWLSEVATAFKEEGLPTFPTSYERYGLLPFLVPFHCTKRWIVRRVREDVDAARKRFPDGKLVVVAHSFGTYVVGRMIGQGLTFYRVVLCGSILPISFRFPIPTGDKNTVLNDVGSRDIMPVLASKLSWLYGASGSFGFNHGIYVDDRYHARLGHSDFLTASFAKEYWLPYLCDDHIVRGVARSRPSFMLRMLDRFSLYVLLATALLCAVAYVWHRIRG